MQTDTTPAESGEPERIYLQPRCCIDPYDGRQWCEDSFVWDCECDDEYKKPVAEYVRADLAALASPPAPSAPADVREALEQAAIWHEAQAKALSKQPQSGDVGWRRMEHREQAKNLRAALERTAQ